MIYQQPNLRRAAILAFSLAQAGQTVARLARVGGIWFIETRGAE